jgi:hypothetical protein
MPAGTSTTKWFAVATTASDIAIGNTTAMIRSARLATAVSSTIPTRRFQPTCRLGNAAYWFVRPGGCSARYACERCVTVSTRPASSRRGGATGKSAKRTKPIRPDANIASRRR